jgi:peptidoglycan/xylan/chitin deacetylase (PgdA/CDA1 family)
MKPYLIKTPSLIKFLFRNWIWSYSKKEKNLYLTFDDGPTPEITEWVLTLLKKYQAKATFFCIGKNLEQHPHIVQKIIDDGHSIGNHTYNHLKGTKTNIDTYTQNIVLTEGILKKFFDPKKTNPKLFRPPYGKLSLKQAKKIRELGLKIIMWDVLSADFDNTIPKILCLNNVIKHSDNGSIIVFHDSLKAAEKVKYVLPKILDYYTVKGYKFKRIAALN